MTITVYSKPSCPQCTHTIKRLEKHGADFQVLDAREHIDTLKAMGFSQAPVVVPESGVDNAWSGFRIDKVTEAVTAQKQAQADAPDPIESDPIADASAELLDQMATRGTPEEPWFFLEDSGTSIFPVTDAPPVNLPNRSVSKINHDRADFTDATLDGTSFLECSLPEANFAGASLKFAKFVDSDINFSTFAGADCTGADFSRATISYFDPKGKATDFAGANLHGANLSRATLGWQEFSESTMDDVVMVNSTLHHAALSAKMSNAMLVGSQWTDVNTEGTNLRHALAQRMTMTSCRLESSDLRAADLSASTASGVTISGSRLDGVQATGSQWTNGSSWEDNTMPRANFSGSTFPSLHVDSCTLESTDFSGSQFDRLAVFDSSFQGANFSGATFTQGSLDAVDMTNANLAGASFNGTEFIDVDFSGANITGTVFHGATFDGCTGLPDGIEAMSQTSATFAVPVSHVLNNPELLDSPAPSTEPNSNPSPAVETEGGAGL